MIERLVFGTVPRKHHIQLRLDGGALAFEECFTQEGFEGPYTIAYHQRAPHTQRLSDAKHGWAAPVDARYCSRRAVTRRTGRIAELAAGGEKGGAARRTPGR